MPTRTAKAAWQDTVQKGSGALQLGSGAFQGQYSYGSRFEDGSGTNPEELIGAAHAGCFSMAFSLMLEQAGYVPKKITTEAKVSLDAENLAITTIQLATVAEVPDIDESRFQEVAQQAKEGCPVSKALAGVDIQLKAKLQ